MANMIDQDQPPVLVTPDLALPANRIRLVLNPILDAASQFRSNTDALAVRDVLDEERRRIVREFSKVKAYAAFQA
ncbi:MAG: hypothetical protein OXF78_10670 [Rhodospirillales bacterium]|nr:hypothetical protein [Rhodospirillales bacterium]